MKVFGHCQVLVSILLIFRVLTLGSKSQSCSNNGDLRLVGGNTTRDGRVEICYLGEWGTVCGEEWDDVDAGVVCGQLGFESAGARATAGIIGLNIVLFGVDCSLPVNASRLIDCLAFHENDGLYPDCDRFNYAGVVCSLTGCSDGDLRLEGGSTGSQGRVEICQNGTWGTVCGDSWGVTDANVVCRQLGLATTDVTAFSLTHFGRGSGSIFLDEVTCSGNELRLIDCPANPVGVHNCDHSRDAGVICVCSDGDLRLEGGSTGSQGRVEICQNGTWGTVCGDSWGVTDANVVCRQLGFATTGAMEFSDASFFGEGSGSILLTELTCSGTEARLVDCPASNGTESCRHSQDVGVTCDATNCTDGALRLEGGSITSEGGVEVCLHGEWGTVCDDEWDAVDSSVVCRQLGFSRFGAMAFINGHFGRGTALTFLDGVACTGDESRLIDCRTPSIPGVNDCFTIENAGVSCVVDECNLGACGDNGICLDTMESYTCDCNDGFSLNGSNICTDIDECESSPCGANEKCTNIIGSFLCQCQSGYTFIENRCEDIDECSLGLCGENSICENSAGSYLCFCNSGYTFNEFNLCTDVDECSSDPCGDNSVCSNTVGSFTCVCNSGFGNVMMNFNKCVAIGGRSSNVLIVSVVVSATVILLILVATGVIIGARKGYRRHTSRMKLQVQLHSMEMPNLKTSDLRQMQVQSSYCLDVPEILLINSCNLQLGKTIGQGEFGIVYKALLKHSFTDRHSETVAVKTLKGFLQKELVSNLLKECAKMKEFDHPNVLRLRGVCLDGGPAPYIVMPFMTNGSLLSHLKENRVSLVIDPSSTDLDDVVNVQKKLLDMCLQVAKGMEYLSRQRVVHRDLAARNCMINANFVIKVADFGLSESIDVTKDYFRENEDNSIKLPVKWLALESMNDGLFSEKTDVWAYGVTCWEVFSGGKTPYPGVHPMELARQLQTGFRMEKPLNAACSDEIYEIVQSCWDKGPELRPHFTELVDSISALLSHMAGYLNFDRTDTTINT